MKKFVSLLLALIIALSVSVVGFAASNYECGVCFAVFGDEKSYSAHMNSGCLEQYKDCPYCAAKVAEANLEAHKATCPKGAGECKYCGAGYANQEAYAAHLENDCKLVTTVGKDVADILIKILDFLKGVDWEGLLGKVTDALGSIDLGGIVEKIKPAFEKVIGFVTENLGDIELPVAAE
ncbi:MAG: hypothetical protein IKJ41_08630 [Clostridia bacterium]|nr:hypothetical protein [Clostridia bacterium]